MKKLLVVSLVLALSLGLASGLLAQGKKAAAASDCDVKLPKLVTLLPTPKQLPCKMPTDCPLDVTISEFASILTIEPLCKGNTCGVCRIDPCNPCAPGLSWSAKWVTGIMKECSYWRPVKQQWFAFPQKFRPQRFGVQDITIVAEEQDI
jgi:hypothetical protein